MKTLFVTRNFPPTICGIGDHTFRLAREMAKNGADVHVVCGADQTDADSSNGITVHPVLGDWGKKGSLALQETLALVRPDWAAVQYAPHSFHPKGLPLGLVYFFDAFKKHQIPVLTVFHEVKIRPHGGLKNAVVSFLQQRLADRFARGSERVVTSIDLYGSLLQKWRSKTSIVPVGSNITPIALDAGELQKMREKLQIAPGAPVVCTFGNRDVSPFLPMFDRLAEVFPGLVWLISGRNTTPVAVLTGRQNVRCLGEMSAEGIYAHLSLGDLFFMPDPVGWRGDGGTCNKSGSLACGCSLGIPIVGARGDMNNALLQHGVNMLLVDINNMDDIFDAIQECLSSQKKAAEIGRNARNLYEKSLDWPVLAEKFRDLMKKSAI